MRSHFATDSQRPPLQAHGEDLSIVESALAGERGGLDRLVERLGCVPRILVAKNQRLGSPLAREELLDLAQEVLALVWRKLPEYRGDAALESWVYPFCVLELLNARRRKRQASRHFDGSTSEEPAVEDPPSGEDGFARLYEGLAQLQEVQAACIRMRCFQGAAFEAIAERLEIPVGTAKTHYYRGLERLRVLLGPFLREAQ